MADNNNLQSTQGHETEAVNVQGAKAMMQQFKDTFLPAQASAQNQLADKNFVNSGIATATATYRGNFNLVSDLSLTVSATQAQIATALGTAISVADNNDYCYVQIPTADATPTEIARIDRYKNNGTAWSFEYSLNNSGFTAVQWASINSGITSGLVAKLGALPSMIELTALLALKADRPSYNQIYNEISNPTGNPSEQGWYEIVDDAYVATSDTSVVSEKTYYKQTSFYQMAI